MLDTPTRCRVCKRGWDKRVNTLLDSAMTKADIVDTCVREGIPLTRFLLNRHLAHRVVETKIEAVAENVMQLPSMQFAENDDDLDKAYELLIRLGLATQLGRPISTTDLLRAMADLSKRQLSKRGLNQNVALEMMKQLTKKHGPPAETPPGEGEPDAVQPPPPRPANDTGQAAAIVPALWGSPGAAR